MYKVTECPNSRKHQKSRNKKITLTHHDDAVTSAQEIRYYVVCTSHGIVMMSPSIINYYNH